MTRILISGICGYMGRHLLKLSAESDSVDAVCGVDIASCEGIDVPVYATFSDVADKVDCIVDFSHHSQTGAILAFAVKNNIPAVIATTGQTDAEREMIIKASEKVPVFFSSNFCIGVAMLCKLAVQTAKAFPNAEIEIIEKHHNRKLDAPSGTALMIANEIINEARPNANLVLGRSGCRKREADDIGISSVRMGNIVGDHEIIIGTENQTLTLKHEAHSRALFAEGAISAVEFIKNKGAGLYDVKSILKED